MTKGKAIIFGNGELAALNHHYLMHDSPYDVVAFTVDGAFITEDRFLDLPVVPFEDIALAFPPQEHALSLLLGYRDVNRFRANCYARAKDKGYEFVSYVSSKAIVSPAAILGESCYIYETSIIQPFARIGSNVVISAAAIVGHHAVVDDHSFLSARATILGSAQIGSYCVVGAAATILDGICVRRECIIGSGIVIAKDTKEKEVYIGRTPERVPRTSDQFAQLLTWSADARKPGRGDN